MLRPLYADGTIRSEARALHTRIALPHLPPFPHDLVQDLALVIDGPPEVHPLPGDPHHHLVQVPSVARPRAPLAQPSRDRGTELQHPTPYRS